MFQTLQPHQQCTRFTKTAIPHKRKVYFNSQDKQRPNTSAFGHFNFNNTFSNYKTIDNVENQLKQTFRKEMSNYIREKIKSLTHRKQNLIVQQSRYVKNLENPEFNFTINSSKFSTQSPQTLKQIKFNGFLTIDNPCKISKVIDEAFVTNTKQRISRLVSLKKQQEQNYLKLRKSIKHKRQLAEQNFRHQNLKELSSPPPNHVQAQKWDIDWKQQIKKQTSRYTNRLQTKHIKSNSFVIRPTK